MCREPAECCLQNRPASFGFVLDRPACGWRTSSEAPCPSDRVVNMWCGSGTAGRKQEMPHLIPKLYPCGTTLICYDGTILTLHGYGVGRVYTDTDGSLGGRTEFTEVPGTGCEVVPYVPSCRVRVLRSNRNLPKTSVVYFRSQVPPV